MFPQCNLQLEGIYQRSNCRGKKGPTGPTGASLTGPTGPTGESFTGPTGASGPTGESFTGPTGTTEVPVNQTIFVDPQYGNDITGSREDLMLPFQTITAALNAAIQGDLIQVRNGQYNEGNLILKNQVNFFFEEGSQITFVGTNPGDSVFVGSLASLDVDVEGYLNVVTQNACVLNLTSSVAEIVFECENLTTTGTEPMFKNYSAVGNILFKSNTIEMTSGGTTFDLANNTSTNIKVDVSMINLDNTRFLSVQSTALDGTFMLETKEMVALNIASVFAIQADQFNLYTKGNSILTQNSDYIFNVQPPTTPGQILIDFIKIKIEDGGFVAGSSLQPRTVTPNIVGFVQDLEISQRPTLAPIALVQMTCKLNITTCLQDRVAGVGTAAFITSTDSLLTIAIDSFTYISPRSNTGTLFVMNGGQLEASIDFMEWDSTIVDCLAASTIDCLFGIVNSTLNESIELFLVNGPCRLDIVKWTISVTNLVALPVTDGLITLFGENVDATLHINQVVSNADKIDFFKQSATVESDCIFGTIMSNSSLSGNMFNIEGLAHIKANALIYNNSSNLMFLTTSANVTINFDRITSNNITATDFLVNNATLKGYIGHLEHSNGVYIFNLSTAVVDIVFGKFTFFGSGAIGGLIQSFNSIMSFRGNSVEMNQGSYMIDTQGSSNLIFDVGLLKCFDLSNAAGVFTADDTTVSYITIQNLVAQSGLVDNLFVTIGDSLLNVDINECFVACSNVFQIGGNSTFRANIHHILNAGNLTTTQGTILTITTLTSVWFIVTEAVSSIDNVIEIGLPSQSLGNITLQGYMRTDLTNGSVIFFTTANNPAVIRLLSSTLVANGAGATSISHPSGVTFVSEPSIANKNVFNVNFVPVGLFYIDAGVN